MSDEVAAVLAQMKLSSYAEAFDREGWDDLEHLKTLDSYGLREVAASVSMKPGHVSRLLDGFGKRDTPVAARSSSDLQLEGAAPLERNGSTPIVGFGTDGRPMYAADGAGQTPVPSPATPSAATPPPAVPLAATPTAPPPVATLPPTSPSQQAVLLADAGAPGARGGVPPSPGGAAPKACVGLCVELRKTHAAEKLGMCLACSKGYLQMEGGGRHGAQVGYLTVMELDPTGLAARSGKLMLGDMVISVNGNAVGALRETTALLAAADVVTLEVQRLQDENLLRAVIEEVSASGYAAEQKRKSQLSEAEDVLLQSVLQASKDEHGMHIEAALSEEEEQLRLALQASTAEMEAQQEQTEVDAIRDEAVLGGVLEQSFVSFQKTQQAAPPPTRGAAAALAAFPEAAEAAGVALAASPEAATPPSGGGAEAGAVATDAESDSALRSTTARSVSRPEWLDVQPSPRDSTTRRVYEAQRRFVLVQEEEPDYDSDFTRSNSEMV